jgi:hypothetical protein
MKTKDAVDVLCDSLVHDEGYWICWQANIAMAFYDEWNRIANDGGLPCKPEHIHMIANSAANNFLKMLTKGSPNGD